MVLVTGGRGFIGSMLCEQLAERGYAMRITTRSAAAEKRTNVAGIVSESQISHVDASTNWNAALHEVRIVIHLAAHTHAIQEASHTALTEYQRVNVAGTEKLARDAAAHGIRRLVFLSSVKVMGERTGEMPFTESTEPSPEDAYGISKLQAEHALARVAHETGLEVVVIRSPLVYGPGVKGNFLRLMQLVAHGAPLPLVSIENRRSMIYVGNLVNAIILSLESPIAAGKTYLVSDGEDVSTPELIHLMAQALGVPCRLLPFPIALLKIGAALLGKRNEVAKLTASLRVDSSRIRTDIGWHPPFTLDEGLKQTARWYRALPR